MERSEEALMLFMDLGSAWPHVLRVQRRVLFGFPLQALTGS